MSRQHLGKLWLVAVILTHSLIIQYIINIVTEWSVIQLHILWSATQIITRPVCHHESFQDWSEQTAVDRIECTWKKQNKNESAGSTLPDRNSAAGKPRRWQATPMASSNQYQFDGGQLEKAPSAHYLVQSPHFSSQSWKSCMVRTTGYSVHQVICDFHINL